MSEEMTIGHSAELSQIIINQNQMISNQRDIIEELENQTAVLLEQINGFSYISNMLYGIMCILIGVIAFMIIWKVLSKWFFRGV